MNTSVSNPKSSPDPMTGTPLPSSPGSPNDRSMPQYQIPTCEIERAGSGRVRINRSDWPVYKGQGYKLCEGETADFSPESGHDAGAAGDAGDGAGDGEDGDNGESGKVEGDPVTQIEEAGG